MKFKRLKPGMLIEDMGVIIRAIPKGSNKFWGDKEAVEYFCIYDSYTGRLSGPAEKDKDYRILHKRGTKEYERIVLKLRKERLQCSFDAEHDSDLLWAYATS